jgi:hypothetical protein
MSNACITFVFHPEGVGVAVTESRRKKQSVLIKEQDGECRRKRRGKKGHKALKGSLEILMLHPRMANKILPSERFEWSYGYWIAESSISPIEWRVRVR